MGCSKHDGSAGRCMGGNWVGAEKSCWMGLVSVSSRGMAEATTKLTRDIGSALTSVSSWGMAWMTAKTTIPPTAETLVPDAKSMAHQHQCIGTWDRLGKAH